MLTQALIQPLFAGRFGPRSRRRAVETNAHHHTPQRTLQRCHVEAAKETESVRQRETPPHHPRTTETPYAT